MFFFFNDTATTEIYTLSLHDALPICNAMDAAGLEAQLTELRRGAVKATEALANVQKENQTLSVYYTDRKSTRLNSSHANISYAVFCLKKKIQIRVAR